MPTIYHNPHYGEKRGGLPRWTRIPDAPKKRTKPKRTVKAAPTYLRFLSNQEEHIRRARNDPNEFMEYCFATPEAVPFKQGKMHREWQAALGASKRVMIVAPRLHGKTASVIGRSIYELGKDINQQIKIICQSDSKAVKRLQEIREHVTTNEYIHRVFPELHPSRLMEENKHQLRYDRKIISKDPSIDVAGITSSASGDRATIIVADDVVDRRNAITLPRVREQIKEAWDDWINLLPPWGRLWYICTLWHHEDLSHKLMLNDSYQVCWYEIDLKTFGSYSRAHDGTETRSDEPLWPPEDGGPWSKERLEERKKELGTRAFARGFSNSPMGEDEQRVDPTWITYYEDPPETDWPMVLSLDTASTTRDTSDWTGVTLAAIHPDVVDGVAPATMKGTIKTVDAWHAKINFPDKIKMVKGIARRLRNNGIELERVVIERAAGGIELADALADSTGIPLFGITPRHSKTARLERITPYIERGIVQFSPGIDPILPTITDERGDLIGELLAYPLSSKDIADSFVHLVRFATLAYAGFDGIDGAAYEGDDDIGNIDPAPGSRVLTF